MTRTIITDIQMRFADVDMLGHVNNVNLQHYYDTGKIDYFNRVLGAGAQKWGHRGIIAASTHTDYIAQIRFGERISIRTWVERVGNKSLTLKQQIVAAEGPDGAPQLKSESSSAMVYFDFDNQCSIPVPDEWRHAMLEEV